MIRIEKTDVYGFEAAIRGMRNSWNSWDKSDSDFCYGEWCNEDKKPCEKCIMRDKTDLTLVNCHNNDYDEIFVIGTDDLQLMQKLVKAGSDHSKFVRMIDVSVDITAPLYWWKEFDTYKVGTVANSCSTMHKIHAKEFTLNDFSHEHLWESALTHLKETIGVLNIFIYAYNHPGSKEPYKKECWWQIIQLLPSSYNQKRTVQLNYQVLRNIYFARRNHKLDEWREFCKWIEELPYGKELICIE